MAYVSYIAVIITPILKMTSKALSITAVLLLLLGQAFAQHQKDRLLQLLKSSRADTARVTLLYKLGDSYLTGTHQNKKADLQNAKTYFLKAYHLADSLQVIYGSGKYECQCKLAEVFIAQNQLHKARALFLQAARFYHTHNFPGKEAQTYRRYVTGAWHISDDFEDMYLLLLKSLRIYQGINQHNDIVFTNHWIGMVDIFRNKKSYIPTETRCIQTINKYQHTNALYLDYVYSLLARINRYRGDLNKSLSYALKSVELMEATKDSAAAEYVYGELAQNYEDLNQTEKSIFYYKKTIALREKKDMPQEFLFRTAGFVANGLIKLNRPAEALSYVQGLEQRHKPENKAKFAFIEQVKGHCYEALGDYKKAEDAYLGMISDFEKGNTELWNTAEYDIARFYIHRKQFTKAAPYLHVNNPSPNFTKAKDIEYLFFQVDSAGGRFLSAIDHFRKYKTMNDSIFNVARIKQIQELQVRYETAQKENHIRLLTGNNIIQQNNVQRAENQRNLTFAGLIILALSILAFFKSYRSNQRKNVILNQLITEKDSILSEKDNLLVEKEWLLKEIHHRVKNNLQIVMGLLQRQSAYVDSDIALAAIQNSENRMHSIALIHQKLYQSDNLDMVYMPDYIDDFLNYLKDTGDLGNRILFEKELDSISLHVSQAVPLGLILNEAVTNAIKYAYTETETGIIQIVLRQLNASEYLLSIKDHGVGLAEGFTLEQANSMGMNLMRGLSKQLGGVFELDNSGGVNITVRFKMAPQDDHKPN